MEKPSNSPIAWSSILSQGSSWLLRIGRLLEVKPGEGKITTMALCASFFHGVSSIYLFSISHALFLTYFEAQDLPYTYIGGAFTVLLAGWAFSILQHRIHLTKLVIGTLAVLLVTLLGAHLWLMLAGPKWPAAFLAVWTVAYSTLTYMSLWGLFGRVFDTRQAKRLFGLIGAGEFAADIVSGFLTPVLVWIMGANNLLLVAAGGLFLMIVFAVLVIRAGHEHMESQDKGEPEPAALPVKEIFRERYPLLLHLLWLLSLMSFYLLDTAFSNQVERHYKDSADAMTSFLGVFFAVGSAINMLMETFLTGRVLHKIGILKALFILPLGILAGCAALAVCPLVVPRISLTVFALAVGIKMYDYVMRNAIHDPAFQILYQPLPLSKRFAVQSSVLTRAEPTAALIGGGALLLARQSIEIDAVNVCGIVLVILGLQTGLTFLLKSEYLKSLMEALSTRRLGLDSATLYDRQGLTMLLGWLDSRHPGEVIYSMRLLEQNAPSLLYDRLADLLAHPSPEVRASALEGIERLRPAGAADQVRTLIADPALPAETRARAVLAYCSLDEAQAVELAMDLLDSPDAPVARAAMTGLLLHCGIEGVMSTGERLLELLRSPDAGRRVEAARVLAAAGIKGFYRPVRQLLQDPAPLVQRAALLAAEKLGNPRLTPTLLPFLDQAATRFLAVRALASSGDAVLPDLDLALSRPGISQEQALGVIKAAARLQTRPATDFLLENLYYPDVNARGLILAKLEQQGFEAEDEHDRTLLHNLLNQEGAFCAWLTQGLALLDQNPEQTSDLVQLKAALAHDFQESILRMLNIIAFFSPPHSIRAVRINLKAGREKGAYALELLDSLVPEETRRLMHPLLEDLPASERLARLDRLFPRTPLAPGDLFAAIADQSRGRLGPWTRSLALYAMGQEALPRHIPALTRALTDASTVVRETAGWAMARITAGTTVAVDV